MPLTTDINKWPAEQRERWGAMTGLEGEELAKVVCGALRAPHCNLPQGDELAEIVQGEACRACPPACLPACLLPA